MGGVNEELEKKLQERDDIIQDLDGEVKQKEKELEETRETLKEVSNNFILKFYRPRDKMNRQ
jgi:hypothetical protein